MSTSLVNPVRPTNETLYEQDFFAWTKEQARLLRERRFDELDLENLSEEVESVGSSDKREIRNRLEILIAHLLKWQFQPGRRGASWRATISEQRTQISAVVEDSPSLAPYVAQEVARMYRAGHLLASRETGIAYAVFPEACPYSAEEVLDPDYFPEHPEAE